jgi:DNA-binding GntR family transcriptional regulator
VANVPHVGATVSLISRESIAEVFSIMEGLEIVATRSAAERMTEEDARALDEITVAMDGALTAGRNEEWADLNSRFHSAISRLSAMPLLQEMMERVLARWDRVRRYYLRGVLVDRLEQAQEEHRAMLRAMKARDFVGLEQVVKTHNQGALHAYAEFLRSQAG